MKNTIFVVVSSTLAILIATFWLPGTRELPSAQVIQSTGSLQETLCKRHQIPQSLCFFCDPSLREPGRLWCNEHERYEDRCFICRPESKEEDRLWCAAHKLYEGECFICRPELEAEPITIEGKDVDRLGSSILIFSLAFAHICTSKFSYPPDASHAIISKSYFFSPLKTTKLPVPPPMITTFFICNVLKFL